MRVSGWLLRAQFLYLKQRGANAFEAVLNRCAPETREFMLEGFLETRWYPLELFADICAQAEAEFAATSEEGATCAAMGKFACELALNSGHRLLFKFGDVDWLIERASKAWSSHFDEGDLRTRRTPGGAVLIELVDVDIADTGTCFVIKGWMERAAELSGEDSFVCTMERAPEVGVPARWRFAWPT